MPSLMQEYYNNKASYGGSYYIPSSDVISFSSVGSINNSGSYNISNSHIGNTNNFFQNRNTYQYVYPNDIPGVFTNNN